MPSGCDLPCLEHPANRVGLLDVHRINSIELWVGRLVEHQIKSWFEKTFDLSMCSLLIHASMHPDHPCLSLSSNQPSTFPNFHLITEEADITGCQSKQCRSGRSSALACSKCRPGSAFGYTFSLKRFMGTSHQPLFCWGSFFFSGELEYWGLMQLVGCGVQCWFDLDYCFGLGQWFGLLCVATCEVLCMNIWD